MLDIEKVTMTVSQCCNEGKGSRNYPQLMKIWPPCRCGRETTLTTLIVSLALFVTFLQVYMMYRLYPKRDQLDKWVFQINPLLQTFMVAGFFDVFVSLFASIASAEFKKTFTLKQGFEGQLLWRWKYDLATSLEWDVCYVTIQYLPAYKNLYLRTC